MNEDNIIFPFTLLILILAWFFIFKIMPQNNSAPISSLQTTVPEVSATTTPVATSTQIPSFVSTPLPTPFATKPSINIPGGGDGGIFDD